MKKILFLTGLITLLANSGCIVREGHYRGHDHEHYEGHSEVIVGPPAVIVRPPEVIIR
jgi:hypothetical protein